MKGIGTKIGIVLIALPAVLLAGLLLGSENLPLLGGSDLQQAILLEIRLPRVLLGAAVGASLAVSGAALQSLLRNPLAEPYLLGVSNGAALGTMLAIVLFTGFFWVGPIMSFVGAVIATATVYRMAQSKVGMSVERLVLSGIIVTTMLSSAIVLMTTLLDATKLRSFTFWLLGDLSQATPGSYILPLVFAVLGTIVLTFNAKALNLLMLGERDAFDFGVDVSKVRLVVFACAAALVGVSVAAGGSVGYVGLIVPHLVRMTFGSDNRRVIPISALVGAIFVVLADTLARTVIAPRELPVGAITALIGAPLFIYLLKRS